MSRDRDDRLGDFDEPDPRPERSRSLTSPRFHDDFTTSVDAAAYVERLSAPPLDREDRYGRGAPSELELKREERR